MGQKEKAAIRLPLVDPLWWSDEAKVELFSLNASQP